MHANKHTETPPHPDVTNSPRITITPIPTPPRKPASIPFLLFAPWKVLYQVYHLTRLLAHVLPPAQWVLVQNPPSIPTLAVAGLICYLRNSKLMIDWHNYGWTILAGTRGRRHPFVALSKLYECYFGRLGHLHLTVTHAMAAQLRKPPYSLPQRILAVHDRPAAIFRPFGSPPDREKTLHRVLRDLPERELVPAILSGATRLVVSSTSWTPDEDFSLLLDALVRYADTSTTTTNGGDETRTPLLAIITGKGPQRDLYVQRVAELTAAGRLPGVRVATAFLPFADYAALLACADLGICLHKSSSGVDLPMKVVDMFGAGLPVAAYCGYESFGELVKEGENGAGFETAEELANILVRLLGGDDGRPELERLRRGAIKEGSRRWDEEWDSTVGKVMGFVF